MPDYTQNPPNDSRYGSYDPTYPAGTPAGEGYYWKLEPTGEYHPVQQPPRDPNIVAYERERLKFWQGERESFPGELMGKGVPMGGGVPVDPQNRYIMLANLPDQDFNTGRRVIENAYMEDMKPVDALWHDRTQPPPPQYATLAGNAKMIHDVRLNKLHLDKDKVEMTFRRIEQNPNLDSDEQFRLKTDYYSKNPVWEEPITPREKEPTGPFPQSHVQEVLGGLATDLTITTRQSAIAYAAQRLGPDFPTKYPEALDIIMEREKTGWKKPVVKGMPPEPVQPQPQPTWWQRHFGGGTTTPITPAQPNRASLLLRYKQLGGSKTPEGRAFADQYLLGK